MDIIDKDFRKIKKLTKYLNNIADIFYKVQLPITWNLPTGLTIRQSYLETKSTTITPFMYSKVKLTLKTSLKGKFDKNKQVRALMPNLIHSLDSTSLSLLFESFSKSYNDNVQFFSIHDCFGTTCEKVFILKTILASVYIDLYSTDPYLIKFDSNVFDQIERESDYKIDRVNRTVEINDVLHEIHDIYWVLNKKIIDSKTPFSH